MLHIIMEGTIPIDADFLFGAGIFAPGTESLCGILVGGTLIR